MRRIIVKQTIAGPLAGDLRRLFGISGGALQLIAISA